jgi:hypothetical protein
MVGFIRASEILKFLKNADDAKELPTEVSGQISLPDESSDLPDDIDAAQLERLKDVLREISEEEAPRLSKERTSDTEIGRHLLPDVPSPSDTEITPNESDPNETFYSTNVSKRTIIPNESNEESLFFPATNDDTEIQLRKQKAVGDDTYRSKGLVPKPKYKSRPGVDLLLQPDVPKPSANLNPVNDSDVEDVFLQSKDDDNTFTGEFLSPEREEELKQHIELSEGPAKAEDVKTAPGRRRR